MNKALILQKLGDLIELLELCKGDIETDIFDAGGSYLDDAATTCKKLSEACWELFDETPEARRQQEIEQAMFEIWQKGK